MTLDDVSKRATDRVINRIKSVDNKSQPSMKKLEDFLKKIK